MYSDTTRKLFNNKWLFSAPDTDTDVSPERIADKSATVCLPHAWNDEGWSYETVSYDAPAGSGWYFKYLAKHDSTENIFLKFEGVSAECEVFLNGKSIYRNLGAYKAFEVDLNGLRDDEQNLIAVKVTDKSKVAPLPDGTDQIFDKSPRFVHWALPMGSSLKAGGIWRNVWLIRRPKTFIRTPEIRNSPSKIIVIPDIDGNIGDFRIKCELFKDSILVADAEISATESSMTLVLENYKAWLPLQPELYQLETSLIDKNGEVLQTIRQPVAFFDFCVRDSDFYLNGRPYFLRGQNGFPHCNVPHDREYISRYVSKIRAQGVEISRFHTEPPSHEWLDECDRQGIMVIFEMALHGSMGCYAYANASFRKTVIEEMQSLFLEYRRHPSIALWSLGNEMIVACEREIGLGKPLFDILEEWIAELRELDPRPIIANSGSDAAELTAKTVGDVDDVHQYGGWYTENLRDLRNFARFTNKNDMLFQACICTESIAAYTNDSGEFFIKHQDVRQKKIVAMRLGKISDFSKQAQEYQAFMLKEYAEEMWRLRHSGSNFAGYIPFGQYTWFTRPFDKGPDGIKEKIIWDTYRKVMGPVHIQLECWSRNIFKDGNISGKIHLLHENISLAETADFTLEISMYGKILLGKTLKVDYHKRADFDVELGPFTDIGTHTLELKLYCQGKVAAINDLEFKVYSQNAKTSGNKLLAVYDPAKVLYPALKQINYEQTEKIPQIEMLLQKDPKQTILLIGPHALDKNTAFYANALKKWISRGGHVIVLEQTPSQYSEDIFNVGIGFIKTNQPYWSRWATNLVKHADRADILQAEHPVFNDLTENDLRWWNADTFLTHTYLSVKSSDKKDRVLSRIGNGLAADELMPVEYDYVEPGYSIIIMERQIACGSILISSMLVGEKAFIDPVAGKMLINLINNAAKN